MSRFVTAPCALVLLLLLGACIPPEEEPLAARTYSPDTPMGRIQQAGVLVAGVEPGEPWARVDPATGTAEGFTVELARAVAATLRVDMEIVQAEAEELLEMVDDGRADIAFPRIPITERSVRRNAFTNPYWVGHQRLLVTRRSGLASIRDLGDRHVCQIIDPAVGVDLAELEPHPEVIDTEFPDECLSLLIGDRVDSVSAFDVVLTNLMASSAELGAAPDDFVVVGDQLATAGYGAVVESGWPQYASVVNAIFGATKADGRWQQAYARWIQPYLRTSPDPPFLTAEEAAALHPADL